MKHYSVYRCKLCGQRFETDRVEPIESLPYTYVTHKCYGGDLGAAEFLGFKVVDDENDDRVGDEGSRDSE